MERNVIKPLRKDGISQDWLDNTDLEEVFISYLQLLEDNLIDSSIQWIQRILLEIDRRVKAKDVPTNEKKEPYRVRTSAEQAQLRERLEDFHFMDEKEYFKKYGIEKENDNP